MEEFDTWCALWITTAERRRGASSEFCDAASWAGHLVSMFTSITERFLILNVLLVITSKQRCFFAECRKRQTRLAPTVVLLFKEVRIDNASLVTSKDLRLLPRVSWYGVFLRVTVWYDTISFCSGSKLLDTETLFYRYEQHDLLQ